MGSTRHRGGRLAGALISGGEVLTPLMRSQITEAFRVPIVEHYGTHELGTVAWQCVKQRGYHVTDDG